MSSQIVWKTVEDVSTQQEQKNVISKLQSLQTDNFLKIQKLKSDTDDMEGLIVYWKTKEAKAQEERESKKAGDHVLDLRSRSSLTKLVLVPPSIINNVSLVGFKNMILKPKNGKPSDASSITSPFFVCVPFLQRGKDVKKFVLPLLNMRGDPEVTTTFKDLNSYFQTKWGITLFHCGSSNKEIPFYLRDRIKTEIAFNILLSADVCLNEDESSETEKCPLLSEIENMRTYKLQKSLLYTTARGLDQLLEMISKNYRKDDLTKDGPISRLFPLPLGVSSKLIKEHKKH